jgi:hypothetical protein
MRRSAAALTTVWLVTAGVVLTAGSSCSVLVIADSTADSVVRSLQLEGWRGDPTDGREALYAPGCGRSHGR